MSARHALRPARVPVRYRVAVLAGLAVGLAVTPMLVGLLP